MNDELKMKWHSIYGQILFDRKLMLAWKQVEKNKMHGLESHCYLKSFSNQFHAIDAYTRQRLRVCMQHKHPNVRKGFQKTHKWSVSYFCGIKLIPSNWLYYNQMYGYSIEQYVERHTQKWKKKQKTRIEKLKAQGKEYYTKNRLDGIAVNKGLVTT
jgi:hypothetical protein